MGTAFGSITVTKVNDGADAVPISIVSRAYEYKLSPSGSTDEVVSIGTEDGDYFIAEDGTPLIFEENGQWSSTMPTAVPGMFLWTKTITTYSDETVMTDITVTASGRGVDHISTYYYLSTSDTELAGGDWMLTIPPYVDGRYYWTKDETFYTDGTSTSTEPGLDYILNSAEYSRTVVERTDKHFFADADGVHVTVGDNMPNTGKNIRITNDSMQIRNDTTTLAEFSGSYAQIGESSSNNVLMTDDYVSIRTGETETAKFTGNLMRVGLEGENRVEIGPTGTVFYGLGGVEVGSIKSGTNYSEIDLEDEILKDAVFDLSGAGLYWMSMKNATLKKKIAHVPIISSNHPHEYLISIYLVLHDYDYNVEVRRSYEFNDSGTFSVDGAPITGSYDKDDNSITVTFGDIWGLLPSAYQSNNQIFFDLVCSYVYRLAPSTYAFGENCVSSGDNSFSNGEGVVVTGPNSFAIGKYNLTTDAPFVIGCGSGNNDRRDLFKISDTPQDRMDFDGYIYNLIGRLLSADEIFTGYDMIPMNASLNAFTKPGTYACINATYAASQSYQPWNDRGYMVIVYETTIDAESHAYIQIAWPNTAAGYIKFRIRTSSGGWGSWRSIATGAGDLSSYLTTTSAANTYLTKTDASNTYAQKSVVGTIVYKSLGSDTQIAAGSSQKNMASISCAAGIWSVTAHAAFQPGGTIGHYRAVSIGTSATNATYGSFQCGASSGSTVIQTSRHITLTSTTTLYLNVYSQDAITVNSGGTIIEAVRLR